MACETHQHPIHHNSVINRNYYIKNQHFKHTYVQYFKLLYLNVNSRVFGLHVGLKPLHNETTSNSVWPITSKSSLLDIHATFLLHLNPMSIFTANILWQAQNKSLDIPRFHLKKWIPFQFLEFVCFTEMRASHQINFPKSRHFRIQVQLYYGRCNNKFTHNPWPTPHHHRVYLILTNGGLPFIVFTIRCSNSICI